MNPSAPTFIRRSGADTVAHCYQSLVAQREEVEILARLREPDTITATGEERIARRRCAPSQRSLRRPHPKWANTQA